jgi:hypothetical protein
VSIVTASLTRHGYQLLACILSPLLLGHQATVKDVSYGILNALEKHGDELAVAEAGLHALHLYLLKKGAPVSGGAWRTHS